jgi:hypothetical protein
MLNIVGRTVRHQLDVRAPDAASAEVISYIKASPTVEGPPPDRISINIEPFHGFLKMSLASGAKFEGSAQYILSVLHGLHFNLTTREFPGSPLIHGGTITTDEGHIVLVGDKWVGKTTLLVYLASQGWPVAGDEHLVVQGTEAIPRPRSMRVRPGALRYLSNDSKEIVQSCPWVPDWQGSPLFAVEPSAFGKEWKIRSGPIRHLVMLRANHGGRSRLRRLSPDQAFGSLLQSAILPSERRAMALAWLKLCTNASIWWELWTGRLEDTEEILYQCLLERHFT